VARVIDAADLGHPAVAGVDRILTDTFPDLVALPGRASHPWRRLVGAMIRQIIEPNGYEMVEEGRIPKGWRCSFTKGMRYRRRP